VPQIRGESYQEDACGAAAATVAALMISAIPLARATVTFVRLMAATSAMAECRGHPNRQFHRYRKPAL
jgi:hypothetical protein